MRITRHFFEANKPVAVVCHGIEIVSAAGVIPGRTVTTVPKCAWTPSRAGPSTSTGRVVDGNLVTARWHDPRSVHARVYEDAQVTPGSLRHHVAAPAFLVVCE